MYTNIDEMYHAAIRILENRADQLGDDELMHYGRKGMKWYQDIFAEDETAKRLRNTDPRANQAAQALNRAKWDLAMKQKQQAEDTRNKYAQQYGSTGSTFTDEDRKRGQDVRLKQQGQAVREAQRQQRLAEAAENQRNTDPRANQAAQALNRAKWDLAMKQKQQAEDTRNKYAQQYGSTGSTFTDEDRKRGQDVRLKQQGQAVREAQRQQRLNNTMLEAKSRVLAERAKREGHGPDGSDMATNRPNYATQAELDARTAEKQRLEDKKNQLLNKAYAEKDARDRGEASRAVERSIQQEQPVTDKYGRPTGYIDEYGGYATLAEVHGGGAPEGTQPVFDKNGKISGYLDENGMFATVEQAMAGKIKKTQYER